MRLNNDVEVPETLGEYYDFTAAIVKILARNVDTNCALLWLNREIAQQGRDHKVKLSDNMMQEILIPLMIKQKE